MIDTPYKLTNTEVEDILHNMSSAELWQLNADAQPITKTPKVDAEKAQKIYELMDLTGLEYENAERILENPYNATLSDIHIYCKVMKLDVLEFLKKAMSK